MTRKQHGLPPQPFNFFKKIHEHVISKDLGFVILASINQEIISGAVYFHFGEKAVYKYGASDKNYQHLRANNLIMSEAIKWYSQNGFKHFCFGRTEPENSGLIQFKSGWGTTEQRINYYYYNFKEEAFIPGRSKTTGFHNRVFKNMPVPILNKVGALLYRHFG
jgi:lipid II:glycine glycyltransferase (peptidoglycan interpeptide bridge formation enzyme)